MKIYTGTGDRGKTSLFSGERVLKSSLRVVAYGDLDELNAVIGAVISAIDDDAERPLKDELRSVQFMLLEAGSWLATTPGASSVRFLKPFSSQPAKMVESAIDRLSDSLPELEHFILPGGHLSAALAHVARTVCRRTERRVIELVEREDGGLSGATDTMTHILVFLNRLSDYLFVVARACNHTHGQADVLWKG